MDIFRQKLQEYKHIIEGELEYLFDEYETKTQNPTPAFTKMFEEIRRITLLGGAKRIRPILVCIGYELVSGETVKECKKNNPEIYKDIIKTALALELFHTFALVHDDIIDEAYERRGQDTIEKVYRDFFEKQYSGDKKEVIHLSQGATILAGDLLFSIADSVLNSVTHEKVRKQYYDMQFELIAGQADDCFGVGLTDLDILSKDQIINMMIAKSGSYSITNPLLCGLLLSGRDNSKEYRECIEKIGKDMGIVFQLTDDLLGVFGDEEQTGKSAINDIIEGKKTLIMYHTYQKSGEVEKSRMRSILGNKEYKIEDINWLKQYVKSCGVESQLREYCNLLHTQTVDHIQSCFDESGAREFIVGMSQYLIVRSQ